MSKFRLNYMPEPPHWLAQTPSFGVLPFAEPIFVCAQPKLNAV